MQHLSMNHQCQTCCWCGAFRCVSTSEDPQHGDYQPREGYTPDDDEPWTVVEPQ